MNLQKALDHYQMEWPSPPPKGGVYSRAVEFGDNLYYLSGCGPLFNGKQMFAGKLGAEYTVEEGQQAARYCTLNLLANLETAIGDLSRVKRIVKILCYVAGTDTFYQHPTVANGGSELLVAIFGEEIGRGTRSAVGVNALPDNYPVEMEILVEVEPAVQ